MARRKYSDEYKKEAVALTELPGATITGVAKDLGINGHMLGKWRKKAISRELGVSRNTVRRYLRSKTVLQAQARSAKPTRLDKYRAYLTARVEAARPDWIPATVLCTGSRGLEPGVRPLAGDHGERPCSRHHRRGAVRAAAAGAHRTAGLATDPLRRPAPAPSSRSHLDTIVPGGVPATSPVRL